MKMKKPNTDLEKITILKTCLRTERLSVVAK